MKTMLKECSDASECWLYWTKNVQQSFLPTKCFFRQNLHHFCSTFSIYMTKHGYNLFVVEMLFGIMLCITILFLQYSVRTYHILKYLSLVTEQPTSERSSLVSNKPRNSRLYRRRENLPSQLTLFVCFHITK